MGCMTLGALGQSRTRGVWLLGKKIYWHMWIYLIALLVGVTGGGLN